MIYTEASMSSYSSLSAQMDRQQEEGQSLHAYMASPQPSALSSALASQQDQPSPDHQPTGQKSDDLSEQIKNGGLTYYLSCHPRVISPTPTHSETFSLYDDPQYHHNLVTAPLTSCSIGTMQKEYERDTMRMFQRIQESRSKQGTSYSGSLSPYEGFQSMLNDELHLTSTAQVIKEALHETSDENFTCQYETTQEDYSGYGSEECGEIFELDF